MDHGPSVFEVGLVPESLQASDLLGLLKMQIVQSNIILIKGQAIQFESFYEDTHCLICELKASFKNLLPFIFLGDSEYVGRKMRAFQIMLMKLNDCNLPYCEEKLLAVKDEDRIKILP